MKQCTVVVVVMMMVCPALWGSLCMCRCIHGVFVFCLAELQLYNKLKVLAMNALFNLRVEVRSCLRVRCVCECCMCVHLCAS